LRISLDSNNLSFHEESISSLWLYVQAVCFAVLYAIWILPNTILVRNVCLILGAAIGIYQIYYFRKQIKLPQALSIFLLLALFVWMTLHLIFFSNNFAMQYEEYVSVWKRSFLALLFAFGFGLAILRSSPKVRQKTWAIFYLGLVMPTLIYLLKFALAWFGQVEGFSIPSYLALYTTSDPPPLYYVAKTAYMGFCAPALAVTLGQLFIRLKDGNWFNAINVVYVLAVLAIFFVFYQENIKNGMVYGLLFLITFIFLYALKSFRVTPVRTAVFVAMILSMVSLMTIRHIQENPSWISFISDAKIAAQVDSYSNWKCGSDLGYPKNEFGQIVSVTNYERIAWGISGARLAIEYPFGYGLIERSFRQRGNALWPGSCLSQSHSGWIDLTLGIGIPGLILLLSSLLLSIKKLHQIKLMSRSSLVIWRAMLTWSLICFLMIWCTTEISQKVFFEELIFFTALASGVQLGLPVKSFDDLR